jgi:hypothetical protein
MSFAAIKRIIINAPIALLLLGAINVAHAYPNLCPTPSNLTSCTSCHSGTPSASTYNGACDGSSSTTTTSSGTTASSGSTTSSGTTASSGSTTGSDTTASSGSTTSSDTTASSGSTTSSDTTASSGSSSTLETSASRESTYSGSHRDITRTTDDKRWSTRRDTPRNDAYKSEARGSRTHRSTGMDD